MAYAKLATLPVQFGLYSSFMGVLIYWFFATSKDITIGVCVPCSLEIMQLKLTSLLARRCHVNTGWQHYHGSPAKGS